MDGDDDGMDIIEDGSTDIICGRGFGLSCCMDWGEAILTVARAPSHSSAHLTTTVRSMCVFMLGFSSTFRVML
jgi:hypothetical protein